MTNHLVTKIPSLFSGPWVIDQASKAFHQLARVTGVLISDREHPAEFPINGINRYVTPGRLVYLGSEEPSMQAFERKVKRNLGWSQIK